MARRSHDARAAARSRLPPRAVRGPVSAQAEGPDEARVAAPRPAFNLTEFYRTEGVLALFDRGAAATSSRAAATSRGRTSAWTAARSSCRTAPRRSRHPAATLPQVTLAVEHYNRMVRLLEHGVPVKVELHIDARFTEETAARPNSFNIVGEIPGTDKADEIVLLGAHFDSWHGATGATDNAAGSAAHDGSHCASSTHRVAAAPNDSHRVVGRRGERPAGIGRLRAQHLGTSTRRARSTRSCPST